MKPGMLVPIVEYNAKDGECHADVNQKVEMLIKEKESDKKGIDDIEVPQAGHFGYFFNLKRPGHIVLGNLG